MFYIFYSYFQLWDGTGNYNIIDYEHELQCEWLESITEEQYNEFKMLEELNK